MIEYKIDDDCDKIGIPEELTANKNWILETHKISKIYHSVNANYYYATIYLNYEKVIPESVLGK